MKRLRIGLIGCGGIAGAHLASYLANPRTQVVAVTDVVADKANAIAAKAGAKAYGDYLDMIRKESLDAVSLLTPPSSHRVIAERVLAAGVHVFSEKPIACTAADGRAMAAAAKKAAKLLMVAQCHRFHEPVRRAREIIQSGDLGDLSTYRNRFGYRQGTPDDSTRLRGGVWLDNGSHSSYIFRFLVGPVKSAFGWAPASQLAKIEDLCVCTVLLEAVNGAAGVIELDGAAKRCLNLIEVYGSKGTVIVNYGGGKSEFLPAGGNPIPLDDPKLPGSHRFDREIEHFVRCVLGEEQPQIPAEEGVVDIEICEAAFRAMKSGRVERVSERT